MKLVCACSRSIYLGELSIFCLQLRLMRGFNLSHSGETHEGSVTPKRSYQHRQTSFLQRFY